MHRFSRMRAATFAAAAVAAVIAAAAWATPSWAPPGAPDGVTPFASDDVVDLAWDATAGASGYTVLRGTSATNVTTTVGTTSTPSFADSSAVNGTTYYYKVVANSGAGSSPPSATVSALPRNASCSTGNAIVVENCFPGTTAWKTTNAFDADDGGIEAFTTSTSVAAGESLGLKVRAAAGVGYHADIYRTGWYGGSQGRLVGSLVGLTAAAQPGCTNDFATGEKSCAAWSTSATIHTSTGWPSGVYLVKLIRDDNGAANYTIFTLRDASRTAPGLFVVPTDTYEAYNPYGGRSLYTFNSCCTNTVSGEDRAVKVSFDRPYQQSVTGQHDFYTISDLPLTSWLERQGYDFSYEDSHDVNDGTGDLNGRTAIMLGAHDEYQSSGFRNNITAARDAGVDIASFGANAAFWRARYEASSVTGVPDRTLVSYKTTESGAADPVTPTTTWRDPTGANAPENALYGGMYVGQSTASFPLYVTADQGKNRFWRYTDLTNLAPGTKAQVDFHIVGWEWDRRVDNGAGPANVQALSSSPTTGDILQDAGKVYSPGSETQETTIYKAASGAYVWSAGTIQWDLGLGYNMYGTGEPDPIIQQGTANVLADMNLRPGTPSGVSVDATGNLQLTGATPPLNANGTISTTGTGTLTFDRPLDPSTVKPSEITVTDLSGNSTPLTIAYDDSTHSVSLTPQVPLDGNTTYNVRVGTGIAGWNGQGLSSAQTFQFTTGAGTPPVVTARTPASGATSASITDPIVATFDRGLKASTVTAATVKLASSSGQVAGTVAYDSTTRQVSFTPTNPLAPATTYTATLTTGIQAVDGTPLASTVTWTFTTADVITVTSQFPAPLASGLSTKTPVHVTFSRSIDPSTLTATSFKLTRSGAAVTAAISYDASTRTATLTPTSPLVASTTYTVTVGTQIRGIDDAPLGAAAQWTFTTALTNPPAPAMTASSPTGGATQVPPDGAVTATFDRALDPASLDTSTVSLTGPSGAVAAAIAYDPGSQTVTLTPSARLASNTTYQARLTTGVRSALGEPLPADLVWSFTTASCPCMTMAGLAPDITGVAVQDGRTGAGPWSRELGVKLAVDTTSSLTAVRFYKSPGELGTHVGRVWSSTGGLLASVTFTNETASGWQQQALSTPVTMKPGRVYVLSINANTYYVVTRDQLATSLAGGPVHTVADGADGVYGDAAGSFPNQSWRTSNYFVDGVVTTGAGAPAVPQVSTTSPLDGASGASTTAPVTAGFSVPMDPSTINGTTFTLKPLGGNPVSAQVTYDENARTATLTPSAPLAAGTTYEARVTTGVHAYDDTPLAADVAWRFTTVDASKPQLVSSSPANGATSITTSTDVRGTFSLALDPTTVTTGNVKLTGPNGAAVTSTVSYDTATKTIVLKPSAALAASTTYTATVTTGVKATTGVAVPSAITWTFTTSGCPCQLFDNGSSPDGTRPVQDGRVGPGPWSYEMGVKIQVTQPAQLTAIRFYKSSGETGTHIGRVWTASGTQIAQVTFTGESATGWQQQALATPVNLTPGQVYVVSVGINAVYSVSLNALASAITSGPLQSVADGANGVYGSVAGSFPTQTWATSNYWVDAVVR